MVNRKIVLLITCVLAIVLIVPAHINFANSSIGAIRINGTTTSDLNQQILTGESVNLYFGDSSIKWSGSNFYLLLSHDLENTVSPYDYVYSPMFSVADLKDSLPQYYSNVEGEWVIGNNWVNGTLAKNMAAGKYSIKAFDFGEANSEIDTGTVAVTDTFITVNTRPPNQTTFTLAPNNGSGGVPVQFSGSGYPPNTEVDIGYYEPVSGGYNVWKKIVTDVSGSFSFSEEIPDLGRSYQQGDNPETFNRIQFRTQCQGLIYDVATYDQYARGLKSIGGQIASGLYGNGTNLVSIVKVKAGDTFTITGQWFHPGIIYVLLDSEIPMGTVTHSQWSSAIRIGTTIANGSGFFEVPVNIPKTIDTGEHYIAIEDSQSILVVQILITDGDLQISPNSGPGGAKIQFTGSGYPPLSDVDIMYRDTLYGSWNYWTTASADAKGNINFSAEIPDLKKASYAGDYSTVYSQIAFRAEVDGKIFAYEAYTQYARGLKQVGSKTASTLFGNSTNFENYGLTVKSGDSITISGRYFHPGVVYVRWDGTTVVNTVTSDQWSTATILGNTITNAEGSFDITITIPTAENGLHWVSIEDSQTTNFITRLLVNTPSPTPSTSSSSSSSPTSKPTPTSSTPSSDKPTPIINIHGKSTFTDGGFKVEISGTCLNNNNVGLANKTIQLYSSKDSGKTWEPLTIVNTDNEGRFNAIWMSTASGIFLIKAECPATTEYNKAVATINLAIEPALSNNNENVFTVTSNSTVSQLSFNSEDSELSFTASGETGTTGYVRVTMPKTLINDLTDLKVYLDGKELTFNSLQEADAWVITITYTHSTHSIIMYLNNAAAQNKNNLPLEWIIAAIIIACSMLAAAAIIIAVKKKTTNKN
ncbi:MAG: hypothetical protein FWH37_06105 [Candidatus Bathyarchaeota archaeon]|nr:hypothetical protein [Candidatus Termiticorpusculum sp.]